MLNLQIAYLLLFYSLFTIVNAVNPGSRHSRGPINGCNYTKAEFESIFDAINRGLDFFDENLEKIILDTAMGTRTIEAQIAIVLDRENYGNSALPLELEAKLAYLLSKVSKLSPKILTVFVHDPEISLITKLEQWYWVKSAEQWMIPNPNGWRPMSEMNEYFNETSVIRNDRNYFRDSFYGYKSDECISQLFDCKTRRISEMCKDYFFTRPQSSYTLNHQILYVLMAEKHACHKTRAYRRTFADVGGWDQFRKDLCGKVWFLANVIAKRGFSTRYWDMFAEQVAVCSLAGYPNFLRKDWLERILSWQTKAAGCFLRKDADNRLSITTGSDDDYVDVEAPIKPNLDHLLRPMKPDELKPFAPWQIITQKPKTHLKRQKRGERIVQTTDSKEFCGFHFTSVGMMVLAIHLRYFVETCSELYASVPIPGES